VFLGDPGIGSRDHRVRCRPCGEMIWEVVCTVWMLRVGR